MKPGLKIVAFAVALTIVVLVAVEVRASRAQRNLAESVERIRPFVTTPNVDPGGAEAARVWTERLATHDETLDRLARSDKGLGAPWMWTSEHEAELEAIVRDVTPTLDALARLALERRPLGPMPRTPKLGKARHRTNLICAAAWLETDPVLARGRLLQAMDVARIEDDGGYIAAFNHLMCAGFVAHAARSMAERDGRDEELVSALKLQFAPFADQRYMLARVAREAVDFVDRGDHHDLACEEVVSLRLFLDDLQVALADDEVVPGLALRTPVAGLFTVIGAECSPAGVAQRAKNLRL